MSSVKNNKKRNIPPKNYLYLSFIIVGSILLIVYICNWYKAYNESKLYTNIMNQYLTVINYNELDNYITENKDAVIYVSILGSKEINKFEEKYKNNFIENNLKNNILYLDLTNENRIDATRKLQIENNFPYLVIYTNGKITDVFNIADTKYNPKKVMKYLNRIGATESD